MEIVYLNITYCTRLTLCRGKSVSYTSKNLRKLILLIFKKFLTTNITILKKLKIGFTIAQ